MTEHKTGTREEWEAARKKLLEREEEVNRLSNEAAELRRELPWVQVEEEYAFETDDGKKTLAELFDGARSYSRTTSCSAPSTQALAQVARVWPTIWTAASST